MKPRSQITHPIQVDDVLIFVQTLFQLTSNGQSLPFVAFPICTGCNLSLKDAGGTVTESPSEQKQTIPA
jgi:hypothetical protein